MHSSIGDYIARVRNAVCPRTAYATAGGAAKECRLYCLENAPGIAATVSASWNEQIKSLKECLIITKEFHTIVENSVPCNASNYTIESKGNVTIIMIPLTAIEESGGAEVVIMEKARILLSTQQSPLIIAIFEQGAQRDIRLPTNDGNITHCVEVLHGYKIVAMFASSSCDSMSSIGDHAAQSSLGSKGQPSVQSRRQFAYLWEIWQNNADEKVITVDSGKERVLQRLADRTITAQCGAGAEGAVPVGSEQSGKADDRKLSAAEWDKIVKACLESGMDDFGVYNAVRLHTLGRTLQQDLEIVLTETLDEPPDSHDAQAEAAPARGRANFMVTMTLQCIPDRSKRPIKTVLDYGCAEGAITAELGRQLGLTPDRIFGADVRAIPSEGFTFMPLLAEEDGRPPAMRRILPGIADSSVDLITSAMVFHHVTHVRATLLELRRVISPQGVFILREHHCPSAEMAAFLDIMHGLYSLSWSQPVEWPKFIQEYKAWYRTQEEWNSLILDAGFMRLTTTNTVIQNHYDAAGRSKKKHDGKYGNLIRAYYAVYLPNPDFEVPTPAPPTPIKRRLENEEEAAGLSSKRTNMGGLPVFESKKFRQQFYILAADGKPIWIKLLRKNTHAESVIHPADAGSLEVRTPTGEVHAVSTITYC